LALAERREPRLVRPHVPHDLGRVGPRVLSQRPADRLLEEELLRRERRLDAGVEEIEIGLRLEAELGEDRAPALPEIVAASPREHRPAHALGLAAEDRAQAVARDLVDVVPPGAGDDHLLVHRERARRLEVARRADSGELDRRVAVLAVARAAPE